MSLFVSHRTDFIRRGQAQCSSVRWPDLWAMARLKVGEKPHWICPFAFALVQDEHHDHWRYSTRPCCCIVVSRGL